MKTLVVGSSGFVGARVLDALLAAGSDAVGFDVAPSELPSVQGDMASFDDVTSAVVDHEIDRVVVLGYVMAPLFSPAFTDFIGAVNVNLLGVTNVFEASRRAGVKRVVLGSSVGVYGTAADYGDEPVHEDSALMASNLYGRMKIVNETIADRYRGVHDLEIVKVRPGAILGEGNTMWPSRLISPVAVGRPGHAPFAVTSRNNVVAIEDLAELIRRIVVAPELGHDTYVATGHNFAVAELASAIYRVVPDAQLNFDDSAPPPAYPTTYDNSRAVEEFGWRLSSLEESVRLHVNAARAQHNLDPVHAN